MAPPRKILRRQLEILVDFLEQNRDISRGTPLGQNSAKLKWTDLAKKLNAVEDGASKSPEGWKKYWFEWRHRCRKKATYVRQGQPNSSNGAQKVSLNDVEVRALNINEKDLDTVKSKSKKHNHFKTEDSDSELYIRDTDLNSADIEMVPDNRKIMTETTTRNSTPPPEWAIALEDRRIAAEERIAKSLEAIVNLMQVQEDRRALIEEKIVDTLAAITSNLKELHNGNRQYSHQSHTEEADRTSMKDVIFL